MLYRALIKTHHIISHKKIYAIGRLAKALSCAVVIKTGRSPGIIIAECEGWDENQEDGGKGEEDGKQMVVREGEERLKEWVSVMKRMRYKYFELLALERVVSPSIASSSQIPQPHSHADPHAQPRSQGRLGIPEGGIKTLKDMKVFRTYMDECGMLAWWTDRMGFFVPAERKKLL